MQVERASGGFHIDLDDFLTGLLLLANELVGVSFPFFLLSCKLIFVHKLFNDRVYSPFGLHCNSCHVVGVRCPVSSSDFVRKFNFSSRDLSETSTLVALIMKLLHGTIMSLIRIMLRTLDVQFETE